MDKLSGMILSIETHNLSCDFNLKVYYTEIYLSD